MPKPSSPASSVPPCLSPESARVWVRLRNYVRQAERRLLLVVRHDSPRLPRELPPLLAQESDRPLVSATVSDTETDPFAAALRAVPGGHFPPRTLLSITGAEDLALSAPEGSRAALYEFARRLDLRRDQFLPAGGVVLVWANARVFDALAEHALNFISRAAAVLTLAEAGEKRAAARSESASASVESLRADFDLPPLPPDAPDDLRTALAAFEELALADELYLQGGPKIAHGLATFDAARDQIEAGWAAAQRWSGLEGGKMNAASRPDGLGDFARALLVAYPSAGSDVLSLRQHPRESIAWLEAAVAAARLRRDRRGEAKVLGNLGLAHADLGDVRKAIELYEQQLVIAREIGDRRGEGNALMNIGIAHKDLGDARKAIELHEQVLPIFREIGDRRGEGSALGNLGNAHADLGDARKAIEFYQQHAAIAHEIGDRRGEGNALGNLGLAHADLGDARKAIEFYEQQLVIVRAIGDRRGEGNALWNSALSYDSLGNRAEAIARAAAALAIFEAIEDPNAAMVRAALAKWRA